MESKQPVPSGAVESPLPQQLRVVPHASPAHVVLAIAVFVILAFSGHLTSALYPITQAFIQILVYAFFVLIGRRHPEVRTHGWSYILIGANLVVFGALVEISQHVWFLHSALTAEHSPFRLFLRQIVGSNSGFLLLGYGFYLWLPNFILSRNVMEQMVRRYQAELVRNEKLNALSGLVASVAHELNNPLAVLVGYAGILKSTRDPALIAKAVAEIERASTRCKKVAENLLVFARTPTHERREVHLTLALDEALQLLEYQLRLAGITVERRYAEHVAPLLADHDKLVQVFFNLMNNAMHALGALKTGRKLTVSCRMVDDRIVVEVADNGPGVPEEIRDKLFEPFFTTKPAGVGTGLGLSICKGILKAHRGTIRLESEPGVRTAFVCELPLEEQPEPVDPAVPPPPRPPLDLSGRRMLVVDDEPEMLDLCRINLAARKVAVDYSRSGEQALEWMRTRRYDLVLLDLRMPQMSGQEVYARLRALDPRLPGRVVFTTGDTAREESTRFLRESGRPCLLKPFTPEDLDRVLEEALRAA